MILVTGGAGFIGHNLIRYLNRAGYFDIIIAEQMDSVEKMRNLVGLVFNTVIDYREVDDNLIRSAEVVFHLGACCDTTETNVDKIMTLNHYYTIDLVDMCVDYNTPLIFASSAATYGKNTHCSDDKSLFDLKPTSPYAISKHLSDIYIDHRQNKKMVSAKFFNVYGSDEYSKTSHTQSFIFKSVMSAVLYKTITLFEDVKARRDFIHVNDVCRMLVEMWRYKVYGVFNIGTGEPNPFDTIAEFIKDSVKTNGDIDATIIKIKPMMDMQNYQFYTRASTTKLTAYGISSNINIRDGIDRVVIDIIGGERI